MEPDFAEDVDMKAERERIIKLATEDGLTRKQISDQYGIPYSRVQYCLREVANVPREPSRGGAPLGTRSPIIEFEGKKMPRTDAVRILADRGMTVSDIAAELNAQYPAVYAALRRTGNVVKSRPQRYVVIDGQEMRTSDAVRYLYRQGMNAKEISEHIGLAYQTAYNTIRLSKQNGSLDADE